MSTNAILLPKPTENNCLRCRGAGRIDRVDSIGCHVCKGSGKRLFTVCFVTHANTPQREHIPISLEDLQGHLQEAEIQDMIDRASSGDPYTAYWDASVTHYASLVELDSE